MPKQKFCKNCLHYRAIGWTNNQEVGVCVRDAVHKVELYDNCYRWKKKEWNKREMRQVGKTLCSLR